MLSKEENELLTRTGPGTPMGTLFRRFWVPALLSEELPEPDFAPVRLRLLGEDLVAFRETAGSVGILDAYCAHRRARLFLGRNEESGLRCIYHGWKYDVAGRCVEMPAEPAETDFKEKVRITAYPTREVGGVVWAFMGPAAHTPELPGFEWCQVPASQRLVMRWIQECNYFQALEGEMDPTHAAILHQWFDLERRLTPSGPQGGYAVEGTGPRFARETRMVPPQEVDHGMVSASYVDLGDGRRRWRVNRWLLPFFSLIATPSYPVGGRCFVPIDDNHVTVFQYLFHPERPLQEAELRRLEPNTPEEKEYSPALERTVHWLPDGYAVDTWRDRRNLGNDYLQDRQFQQTRNMSGVPSQRTQDAAMVERQGVGPVADRSRETLRPSDRSIMAMRRILLRAARDLQDGIEPANARHSERYATRALEVVSPHTELERVLGEVEEPGSKPRIRHSSEIAAPSKGKRVK